MKRILLLLLLCSTTLLMAQQTDPIQEAMASYDYETALSLIAQKKPATPLLLQKGKALRSLGLNAEALSTYQEIMCFIISFNGIITDTEIVTGMEGTVSLV